MSLVSTIDDGARYQEMYDVVRLFVKNKNPTEIARELGLRRVDVIKHIDDWRTSVVHSDMMKERVDELIGVMDEHFGILIQKAYEVIEEVDRPIDDDSKRKETMTRSQMLSQKMNAIKTIADLEGKRIDILQKSGLLEAADLGDELAAMEEQKQMLVQILSEELCDYCKPKVMGRISGAMSSNNITVVDAEIVDE
jgi:hypothetical protein